jgi:ubiquinone/menaquinone biosynthesis C-methylase UbiE
MESSKRRTYWDTFESSYQMGPQKHRIYLLDLLKRRGVTSLFDVGCGTGPIYDLIISHRYPIIYKGTDYSPAMIEVAQRELPNGLFEVQDARRLTEKDGSWNCVLLMHVLDHLDDYKAAIKEAARVSSKYVMVVLWRSFVDDGTHLNDRNMMGKNEGEDPWQDTFLQEYSKSSLDEAFEEAGLVIEETAEGERINDEGKYNFIYLLRKK